MSLVLAPFASVLFPVAVGLMGCSMLLFAAALALASDFRYGRSVHG